MSSSPSNGPSLRAHGGPDERELAALALRAEDLVDFSTNVNPYGPSEAMIDAIRRAPIDRYPDPTARAARHALARHERVAAERIVVGNGVAELLWTLARVALAPGRTALVVEPTFAEAAAAIRATGARLVEWRAEEADGFAIDLPRIDALLRVERPALLYLCAPNNPTGVAVPASAIRRLADAHPATLLALDQAYLSLSDRAAEIAADLPESVVRLRSLTKEHAIPGVRVGYAIAPAALAAAIEAGRAAWTTSAQAHAAAIASCGTDSFVADSRRRLLDDRDQFVAGLRALGLQPRPSSTHFVLVSTADPATLRRRLLTEHRLLVRDCRSFGLPSYIRLAARPRADRERLFAALRLEISHC